MSRLVPGGLQGYIVAMRNNIRNESVHPPVLGAGKGLLILALGCCILLTDAAKAQTAEKAAKPRTAASAPAVTPPDYPRTNLAIGYEVDPDWPARPIEHQWGDVPGLTIDGAGRIWSFNRSKVPVQVFAPDGRLVDAWGQGVFKTPHGVRADPKGDVWFTDISNHVVQKFTPKGKLLMTLGTLGVPGEDGHHFNRPTDIVVAPRGDLFISDGYTNNRIAHFDAAGRFVKAWGKLGVEPGEFSLPHAIAMDSHGRLYVCDRNNARVQVFEQSSEFIAEWRNLMVPWGIWITPKDEVYLCGSSPMRWPKEGGFGTPPKDQVVMKLDTAGRVQELWTFPMGQTGKEQPGELNWLHGIAVDASGNLYLSDIKGRRIQKFVRLER